eukprot:17758_6
MLSRPNMGPSSLRAFQTPHEFASQTYSMCGCLLTLTFSTREQPCQWTSSARRERLSNNLAMIRLDLLVSEKASMTLLS